MPVEIKEIIIKATIEKAPEQGSVPSKEGINVSNLLKSISKKIRSGNER